MKKIKPFIFLSVIAVMAPLIAFAAVGVTYPLVPCTDNCSVACFYVMIDRIISFLLYAIAMPLSATALMVSGIYLVAGGSEKAITTGKAIFKFTLIGLFIAFGAWLIVDLILGNLLQDNYKVWNEFPSGGCSSKQTSFLPPTQPPIPPTPPTPPTPSPGAFSNRSSPALTSFTACMQNKLSGMVVTSTTDNNIVTGLCNLADPNEKFNDSKNCQHAKNSCHYGGANCASKGSYAIDIRSKGASYNFNDVKSASAGCSAGAQCLDETKDSNGNPSATPHYHISIGSANNCNCDSGMSLCKI